MHIFENMNTFDESFYFKYPISIDSDPILFKTDPILIVWFPTVSETLLG